MGLKPIKDVWPEANGLEILMRLHGAMLGLEPQNFQFSGLRARPEYLHFSHISS